MINKRLLFLLLLIDGKNLIFKYINIIIIYLLFIIKILILTLKIF